MSKRTWACVPCGKTFRRDQMFEGPLKCPTCGKHCEYVHWKIHVPSPKKRREWERFWTDYRLEKELLERHSRGELREVVELKILNMRLVPRQAHS